MSGARRGIAGMRVLVAEDEVFCAMELEQMLEGLECNVLGPINSLDKIQESANGADCALLDVNMKGDNSYSAAQELRERGVPVAFVTGYSDLPECPEQLAKLPRLGKPFNKTKLRAVLGKLSKSGKKR